jgi:hypothetical protein
MKRSGRFGFFIRQSGIQQADRAKAAERVCLKLSIAACATHWSR